VKWIAPCSSSNNSSITRMGNVEQDKSTKRGGGVNQLYKIYFIL
jgi:hypothetical protein